MSSLHMNTNENMMDWKFRICVGKVNGEIAESWEEIHELLGETCSISHMRKKAQGMAEVWNYVVKTKQQNDDSPVCDDDEIYMQKIQVQDQRREYRKYLAESGRFEHFKEEVIQAVEKLNQEKPIVWSTHNKSNTKNVEGLALFSDWHYGIESKNYWNTYNPQVFQQRINTLTNEIIKKGKLHKIKCLHVMNLGDAISGLIHVSVRVQQAEDVISQVMTVSETMAQVLQKLAYEFEEVKFYNVRGNHDRVTPAKNDAIAKESFADLIPWFLKTRLVNIKNLEIVSNQYDDEIAVADICGHTVLGVHGHKNKMNTVASDLPLMLRMNPTTICMGHFHHNWEKEFQGIDVIVNPSFSGMDEYARDIRKHSKPMQKFLIFDVSGNTDVCKILL